MLISGYHFYRNSKGKGLTSYFHCVKEDCPAKATTTGELTKETVRLKSHNKPPHVHNHPPDQVGNLLALHSHNFRQCCWDNPHQNGKAAYDSLTERMLVTMSFEIKEEFLR